MTEAKRLAGLEERWAEERATRLRYYTGGEGPPLVLVHGLGGAAVNWTALAPILTRRFRLLVPDLPGHGGSSPTPALPNLNPLADAVHALAEREGLAPAILVGHSLGGLVALRHALRHPDATSGVVLAAAAGISSSRRFAEIALTLTTLVSPGRLVAPYRRRVARSALLRTVIFGGWGAADATALRPDVVEAFLETPPLHTGVAAAARALVRDEPRPDLERVTCPGLVLWGARDRLVPVEDAFAYARRLRWPVRIVADCGHLLIGERPDACADAIVAFAATDGDA